MFLSKDIANIPKKSHFWQVVRFWDTWSITKNIHDHTCTTYTYMHHQIPPKYKIYPVGLPSVLYETPGPNERSLLNQLFLVLFIVLFTFQVLFMKTTMLFMKTATFHENCNAFHENYKSFHKNCHFSRKLQRFSLWAFWVITKYRFFVRKTKHYQTLARYFTFSFDITLKLPQVQHATLDRLRSRKSLMKKFDWDCWLLMACDTCMPSQVISRFTCSTIPTNEGSHLEYTYNQLTNLISNTDIQLLIDSKNRTFTLTASSWEQAVFPKTQKQQ